MDWAPWDFDVDTHAASDPADSERLALRREMHWRVPAPVVALTIVWHALRAAVRAYHE
jgi:hypothetical protein